MGRSRLARSCVCSEEGRCVSQMFHNSTLFPFRLRPLLPLQEERSRLHAEMARMQSLEEEALLSGTVADQQSSGARGGGSGGTGGGEDAEGTQIDGDETDDYSDQVFLCYVAKRYTRL